MKRLLAAFSIVAATLIFNSCSSQQHIVTEQPVAPVYARPATPGATYIWSDGDWRWRGGKYVFSNGSWIKPKPNREWVNGTWVKADKGYYWKKGYWK